jgi:hypothetical protein
MASKNSLFRIREENGDIGILHYQSREGTDESVPTIKSRILQWFGMILMLALGAGALAPNALHISAEFRPWVFIALLLWSIVFCAGIFNP